MLSRDISGLPSFSPDENCLAQFERNLACLRGRDGMQTLVEGLCNLELTPVEFELVEGTVCTLRVAGLQLTSAYDYEGDAIAQCQALSDEKFSVATLYGYGLGFQLRWLLLNRPQLTTIRVAITSLRLFKTVLMVSDQTDVLGESKVSFYYADSDVHLPRNCSANPPEIVLAEKACWKIRDTFLYQFGIEECNRLFAENYDKRILPRRLADHKSALQNVQLLEGTHDGVHAYVVGAGPTLNLTAERLRLIRSVDKSNIVIACDTACRALHEHGVIPDYVVTIDPEVSFDFHLKPYFSGSRLPNLVLSAYTPPEIVNDWRGACFLAAVGIEPHLLKQAARLDFEPPQLFSAGSVIHAATDLACFMGCGSITFLGADFGFPGGSTHAAWGNSLDPMVGGMRVLNGNQVEIESQPNFLYYLVGLQHLIALRRSVAFFNSSKEGALIHGCDDDPTFFFDK